MVPVNFLTLTIKREILEMSDGQIPVNLSDLPITVATLDESEVYTGELSRMTLAPKTDKNGNLYCSIATVVQGGDYDGQTIGRGYLAIPRAITEDMSKSERIKAQNAAAPFARFCRSFKIDGQMPGLSLSDHEAWDHWASQQIGRLGKFSVQNQEYPEGSGQFRSGINDFVVS